MSKYSKKNIALLIIVGLVVSLTIALSAIIFHVDTIDVTSSMKLRSTHKNVTEYYMELTCPDKSERYELMFQSTGNVVTVESRDMILYEYGDTYAKSKQMIGKVFVHVFLPENVYNAPIHITLRAVDSNASNEINKFELCPHKDSTHYYIANLAYGFPLAFILLAAALCIPIFLLLGNERKTILEGVFFALVLSALSILLLDNGGHFMLFVSDQHSWGHFAYIIKFLFPALFLLYFAYLQTVPRQRRVFFCGVLVNFAFCLIASILANFNIVHFCDLNHVFYIVLAVNMSFGIYAVVRNIKEKRLSKSKTVLLNLGVIWGLVVLALIPFEDIWQKLAALPEIDPLSICSILFFYSACGLFFESAKTIRDNSDNKLQRIEELEHSEQQSLSTEAIAQALSARYESIYSVEMNSGAYKRYHESEAHGELGIDEEGDDFFETITKILANFIHPDDLQYFKDMISKEVVLSNTQNGELYSFVYRVLNRSEDGFSYHKVRCKRGMIGDNEYIFIGIRDIDAMMKREKEHEGIHNSLLQRERNHMSAILSSAVGYMEINLSQNKILDHTNKYDKEYEFPYNAQIATSYSDFLLWWADYAIVENIEGFLKTNDRNNLMEIFNKGILRASVSFSSKNNSGNIQPCRQVVFIYRDTTSNDIMCLNITYDLTEQQRAEKEMKELKEKLQMARLRVFTGQMQPHFLYNALGSIQEIVLDNPQYASELIGDFTIHLRASIRAMSSDDPIPFEQELENIKAYTNIEKMRFGKKLNVIFDINTTDFMVSPLSIQPLMENAIRHGIYERGIHGGTVKLKTIDTATAWIIKVVDNGVGFETSIIKDSMQESASRSTGLKNLIFRLNKVMNAQVVVNSRVGHGTCVTVTIPKEINIASYNS